jgi:hypothetical protein
MLSTAMAAIVNFLMTYLLWKDFLKMRVGRPVCNLQLGQRGCSFRDIIHLNVRSATAGHHS